MKILIIETVPVRNNTSIAHVRNALVIAQYLNERKYCDCLLIDSTMDIDSMSDQYDLILVSSASMYFDLKFSRLMDKQRDCRVGWITNEFELFANDFVKQRMDFMITNFEASGIKKAHRHDDLLVTNLNALNAMERNPETYKKYSCCYYGTYRKYREQYFRKYLQDCYQHQKRILRILWILVLIVGILVCLDGKRGERL